MTADRLDCTGEASGDRRYAESLPNQYRDQRFYEHRVVVAQYDLAMEPAPDGRQYPHPIMSISSRTSSAR